MVTDAYPVADLGPWLSAIAVALSSLPLLAFAIATWMRARKRQALADAAAALLASGQSRASGLREGEILLSGVVEHAPGEDVAVRVDVTQHGTESESSGSWSYHWSEVDREIIVKPFYLVLADGTRVRVLAPPNVDVADDLNRKVLISNTQRVLSAELVPGESLHAQGWLERGDVARRPGRESGYRDVEREWQLVPANGRMLLSSQPLGAGLEKRAAFHRKYARRALILFAVLQLSFANYYARAFGSDEATTVVSREHRVEEDSDGDPVDRYYLVLRVEHSLAEVQVESSAYRRAAEGSTVVIRRGLVGWDTGRGGTLFFLHGIAAVVFSFALMILYGVSRPASRPWYRRRVDHRGSGRLPGS